MAGRATRSASREARLTEAVATGPLGALSHDELGMIFDGLADPLDPAVAVALSSACLGLRTPLRAALEVLQQRHEKAKALCHKLGVVPGGEAAYPGDDTVQVRSCKELSAAHTLFGDGLTTDNMATLSMILRTNGLKTLSRLTIHGHYQAPIGHFQASLGRRGPGPAAIGTETVQALFEGLGRGAAPSLYYLNLGSNRFGPAGAEALAAALRRGAMPELNVLVLDENPIGDQGVAALATPLRKHTTLRLLHIGGCGVGDEGVTTLVVGLGKDDFKALEQFYLNNNNNITDAGCATLVSAIDGGRMPELGRMHGRFEPEVMFPMENSLWDVAPLGIDSASASDEAVQSVFDALSRAETRRSS